MLVGVGGGEGYTELQVQTLRETLKFLTEQIKIKQVAFRRTKLVPVSGGMEEYSCISQN